MRKDAKTKGGWKKLRQIKQKRKEVDQEHGEENDDEDNAKTTDSEGAMARKKLSLLVHLADDGEHTDEPSHRLTCREHRSYHHEHTG